MTYRGHKVPDCVYVLGCDRVGDLIAYEAEGGEDG